jgi:hypothetical protein
VLGLSYIAQNVIRYGLQVFTLRTTVGYFYTLLMKFNCSSFGQSDLPFVNRPTISLKPPTGDALDLL